MDNSDVQFSSGLISGGVILSANSPSHRQRTCEVAGRHRCMNEHMNILVLLCR